MLKSMTGYGEGRAGTALGEVRIELKSVNHRFTDFKINIPKELSFLEPEFTGKMRKKIKRGMVILNLYWEKSGLGLGELQLNKELVKSLEKSLRKLQKELKSPTSLPLELIANFPGVFYFTSSLAKQRKIRSACHKALREALDNLVRSRREEGKRIEKDINNRLNLIDKEVSKIEQVLPRYQERLREKLKKKLKEIKMEKEIDAERLNKEIAFNLIRSDFTEELVRIKSHLKLLKKLITQETSGKNIEFFLQEFNREINTLSDKASEVEISRRAIRIKTELEKIRQQNLNLE